MNVVLHCVNLGNVEVALNLLLNKLVLACMKAVPGIFKPLEGVIGVSLKVSIVYEIEDSTSCLDDFRVGCIGDHTKKDLLHILVLVPSPLGNEGYPFLEMTKAWVPGHCLETSVNFTFPTDECFGDPLDQVILEDALVELMEDIGGERGKDIAEGEVYPERINRS